ncbi:phosphate acetyltransferase [Peptoniphilus catoniae]|uniref:phosphate acetyltransferase n=1 Tax=Peptoniphilus catoniae TaxID=1660341 RepID=UPI0010FF58AA|nr:phosphate acetyltransferase [Peptoniphilus catoniae]
MDLIKELKEKIKEKKPVIVYPEGEDPRILAAAKKLQNDGYVRPIILGKKSELEATAKDLGIDLSKINYIDPNEYEDLDYLVEKLMERRKGKLDEEKARKLILDPNYFGTMLVYTGKAEGMVSGAAHTTAETVRPALQIIKTKEGVKRTSGAFLMLRGEEVYLMADCAINIELDSQGLAEVAVLSNELAKQFKMDPKIAMLSFSTKGSASHELVDKVANAVKLAHEMDPEMKVDGEFQFDAAFVPEVAKIKAPGSEIAGHANVFIFPSIDAGNIGYKLAQRFGGFRAIGPILQGLNAPVNDLSRGCTSDEAYYLGIITAAQTMI